MVLIRGHHNMIISTHGILKPITSFTNNRAVDFDGSNEHLVIADNNAFSFPLASPFSITMEVYMDDATAFWAMTKGNSVGNQYEYVFGCDFSDKLVMYMLNPASSAYTARIQTGTITALQGQWIQIAATNINNNDPTNDTILYINGSSIASAGSLFGAPVGMTAGTGPLRICRYFDQGFYANGRVRRATLWNKVLSLAEVAEDYDIALVTPRAFTTHSAYGNVIVSYDCGNNPGDIYPTIIDVKSGLNATMTNMEAGDFIAYP